MGINENTGYETRKGMMIKEKELFLKKRWEENIIESVQPESDVVIFCLHFNK